MDTILHADMVDCPNFGHHAKTMDIDRQVKVKFLDGKIFLQQLWKDFQF